MSENKNISLDTSRGTFLLFPSLHSWTNFFFPVCLWEMVFGYILGDSPCTLCWGQRIAMIFIALCAFFIVRYGFKPKYIASLLSSPGWVFGSLSVISLRTQPEIWIKGFGLMVLGAHTLFLGRGCVLGRHYSPRSYVLFFAPKVLASGKRKR